MDYSESNVVHIVNRGHSHFEPILDKTKIRSIVQQKDQQRKSQHSFDRPDSKLEQYIPRPETFNPQSQSKQGSLQQAGLSIQSSKPDVRTKIENRRTSINNRELLIAVGEGNLQEVRRLIGEGADIHFADRDGDTVLHYAVEYGNKEIVQFLLSKEAKIDVKNKDNETPLDIAERLKRQDIVQILK